MNVDAVIFTAFLLLALGVSVAIFITEITDERNYNRWINSYPNKQWDTLGVHARIWIKNQP